MPPNMTTNAFNANHETGKNRFNDVPCQDKLRVVLKWPGYGDYIHANYVGTPVSEKRFICTQVSAFVVFKFVEEFSNVLCTHCECQVAIFALRKSKSRAWEIFLQNGLFSIWLRY